MDRERLLNLSGRGRKPQLALAQEYDITRFPAPAGGCLLTDPRYTARLKELLRHVQEATRCDLELLKYGRHFRLPGGAKAVVGRTQRENEAIETLISSGDFLLKVERYPGPSVLGRGVESRGPGSGGGAGGGLQRCAGGGAGDRNRRARGFGPGLMPHYPD